jgi:thioredoxin 1
MVPMNIVHVTDETFDAEVSACRELVLVDFGASWCSPCRALDPVLEEIAADYQNRIRIFKADVEQAPRTARQFHVMTVPTVIFLKDGKELDRFVGAERKDKIIARIEEKLASLSR